MLVIMGDNGLVHHLKNKTDLSLTHQPAGDQFPVLN